MLTFSFVLGLLGSLSAVSACVDGADGHTHDHARRALPSVPLTPPTRPLVWSDINIIHTTDSHGWLLGHQKASFPEPNYRRVFFLIAPTMCERQVLMELVNTPSGDLGDFASFVTHMKEIALVCPV